MHIAAIVVATMVVMAVIVFAMEYYLYRKHHAKSRRVAAPKAVAGESREAPTVS